MINKYYFVKQCRICNVNYFSRRITRKVFDTILEKERIGLSVDGDEHRAIVLYRCGCDEKDKAQ